MRLDLKIRGKLLIILTLFAVLPVAVITVRALSAMEKVRESSMHSIKIASQTINEVIDRNLFERYGDAQAFTYNTAVYDYTNWGNPAETNPLVMAMNRYMKAYGLYKLMLLVGNDGRLLAVNTRNNVGELLNTASLYQRNYAQEKWFSDVKSGKFLLGTNGLTGTAVQQPEFSKIVADVYKSDGYTIAFSAPAVNAQGEVVGVWVNFADFSLVEDIILQQYNVLSNELWRTLDIAVLDPQGVVLVDFDAERMKDGRYVRDLGVIGKLNLAEQKQPVALAAIKGEQGYSLNIHARKHIKQVVGYSHSKGAYDYPGLHWSVLVMVPEEMAFADLRSMERMLLISGAAVLIISVILSLWIGGSAAKPARMLAGSVEKLAAGDKTLDVPMTERHDELGDIARATQIFKDNALKLDRMTHEQEEQKKQAEQEKKASQEKIADDFETGVKGIVSIVASAATELSYTAQEMSRAVMQSSQLAIGATDAANQTTENVQTVASASEELSASVKEISNQLQKTSQLVNQSNQKAENADNLAQALTAASEKVAGAMEMISEISGQINLLALNATIESARAGEAGKGFAVVASEVKNLATQTDKSVSEIQNVIIEMKSASSAIVEALNDIKSSVNSISEATSSVATAVEEQSATTSEIAKSMQIAASGAKTICGNLQNVGSSSSQAGVAAEQMLQATQELSRQAEGLNSEVNGFLAKIRSA